jgi:hypothetical protein
MTIGKTTGNLRAPHPDRDHREDVVDSRDGMPEAAGKANDFPTPLVGENCEGTEKKAENQERLASASRNLNDVHGRCLETFHDMIPKSIAPR